jgi:1,4-dihydroxy-2-naphthoate polyprenyltransferase
MKRFLTLSRAPFLTAILVPQIVATALAYREYGQVNWVIFVLTLIGLAAAHLGANLANDYYDYKLGADAENKNRNQFSGGSPHIVEGIEKASTFLYFSAACFVVAAASGVALMIMVDGGIGPIFWLGLAGFLLGIFYTAPPFKMAYRGFGEINIFLSFGVLPVVGIYYAQTSAMSLIPVLASLPIGLLITNIIWINEFPNYISDRDCGKRQLVVRLGPSVSRYVYYILALSAFAFTLLFAFTSIYPMWSLLALLALPLAIKAASILHGNFDKPASIMPAQGLTIATHLLFGVLFSVGLVVG